MLSFEVPGSLGNYSTTCSNCLPAKPSLLKNSTTPLSLSALSLEHLPTAVIRLQQTWVVVSSFRIISTKCHYLNCEILACTMKSSEPTWGMNEQYMSVTHLLIQVFNSPSPWCFVTEAETPSHSRRPWLHQQWELATSVWNPSSDNTIKCPRCLGWGWGAKKYPGGGGWDPAALLMTSSLGAQLCTKAHTGGCS